MAHNNDAGNYDDPGPPVSCSHCGKHGRPELCTTCEVASYCDRSCRANARAKHDDLCVKIFKQKKLLAKSEEELVRKLGGRVAFVRALGTLDARVDARDFVNRRRNLGLLYLMMSEVETAPHSVFVAEKRAYELFSGAGKSEARNGDRPEDFELILSDPLLKDGLMCWPLWRANTVGFMPCADVMLPVVHLIPRLSHLKPKGVHCETLCSATICCDERKMEWVVETPGTLSYVGSPDLQSCTLTRFTIPSDGGSFLLRLSDRKEPRPSIDCVFRLAIRRKADKKRTYFDLLPPSALRLVASYLTPEEVLNTLLLVRPSFFEHLRNGVAWSELDDWNWLEHVRHVVLASADSVQLLGIDYSPDGRHLTSKWQRVATGKQLRKIIVQDVDFVKGQRFSLSVKEVQFEIAPPLTGNDGIMSSKNFWEEFQPSPPAPTIETVSVGFSPRRPWVEIADFRESFVCLHRGDSFFKAFPHAKKLKFGHQPNEGFFDRPPRLLANLRELSVSYDDPHVRYVYDAVFLYLDRFQNLEVLELRFDAEGQELELLPQDYVHESLRVLRILNVLSPFKCRRVWHAIPRQFPRLRALHVERGGDEPYPGVVDSTLPISLALKRFRRLESITLKGYNVPLGVALKLCSPATVQSVVCRSVFVSEFELTDVQSRKMTKLRQVPGCQVDFHLANGERGPFRGGFRFSFSRS